MAGMVPFAWDDPFALDDQLSEDERMIRDAAHAFAQGELQPRVQAAFSAEKDAPELFPLMGQAGLLAIWPGRRSCPSFNRSWSRHRFGPRWFTGPLTTQSGARFRWPWNGAIPSSN